jgi:hypothetical protein
MGPGPCRDCGRTLAAGARGCPTCGRNLAAERAVARALGLAALAATAALACGVAAWLALGR